MSPQRHARTDTYTAHVCPFTQHGSGTHDTAEEMSYSTTAPPRGSTPQEKTVQLSSRLKFHPFSQILHFQFFLLFTAYKRKASQLTSRATCLGFVLRNNTKLETTQCFILGSSFWYYLKKSASFLCSHRVSATTAFLHSEFLQSSSPRCSRKSSSADAHAALTIIHPNLSRPAPPCSLTAHSKLRSSLLSTRTSCSCSSSAGSQKNYIN